MENRLSAIFKKDKNIVIGAIHLPPLLGYPQFPGFRVVLRNALYDLYAFEQGGVDGIIFENNYDFPHVASVGPGTLVSMALVGQRLREETKLPLGVSVLWNDFQGALALAKLLDLQFIRVPVFVDSAKTQYGTIKATPQVVIQVRKFFGAERIALFTDIHVKHAEMLSRRTLIQSAQLAIKNGSDALLVTGKWTGDAPAKEKLALLRAKIPSFPIVLGSGIDAKNAGQLFQYVNGAIVSTSLKQGFRSNSEVNVKSYHQRIDVQRVRDFIAATRNP